PSEGTVDRSAGGASINVGFLTIIHEAGGYVGGDLVTNIRGRPLEFRLSTAGQPNPIQQNLYGLALEPYVFTDLIRQTPVERASTTARLILVDVAPLLELRTKIDIPLICIACEQDAATKEGEPGKILCHREFAADHDAVRGLLEQLRQTMDLREPFIRIREAV